MKAKVTTLQRGITKNLNGKVDRIKSVASYLNTVVVRQYVNAQVTRWKTQGSSEGYGWAPLDAAYAKRKKRIYAGYMGGGSQMMIATGKLFTTVTTPSDDGAAGFRKVVLPRGIIISVSASGDNEYFKYADEARTFTSWGRKTMGEMRKGLREFIFFARNQG